MLAEQDLIKWFEDNGVGIDILIPLPLIDRLVRKARDRDEILFFFLKDGFTPVTNSLVKLKCKNWDELFTCYVHFGALFLSLDA